MDSEKAWNRTMRPPFVTYILCVLCALMFVLQLRAGNAAGSGIGYPGYVDGVALFGGEYWGLLISFFLHASFAHIAFNLYWLYLFGRAVEPYIGWYWYLLFWLTATAVSSMVQVSISGDSGVGASGFGYALFGFVWIGGRSQPFLARVLDQQTVMLFVVWLFVCVGLTWTGTMAVGNGAHFGGFLFGAFCAYAFLERQTLPWKGAAVAIAVVALLPLFYAPWLGAWNLTQASKAYNQAKYDRALTYLDRVNLPEYATYVLELRGDSLAELDRDGEAVAVYKILLSDHSEDDLADPGFVYNEYAWILATSPDDKLRNATDAIHYAQLACEKDDYKEADSLDTLAAAYASANQFDQAVQWEQKAIDSHSTDGVDELEAHLKLFKAQKPYREEPGTKSAGSGT